MMSMFFEHTLEVLQTVCQTGLVSSAVRNQVWAQGLATPHRVVLFACRGQAFVGMPEDMSVSNTDVFKSCSLFRGFSETGILLMGKLARDRNIPAGTPIFVENMVAESLFVIRSGVVRLSIKSPDGRDHPLEKLAPGDGFGELSLLIGGHRMVTALAETDCELLEIPRRDFAKLQKQKPQTCLKLMINIVKHFGKRVAAASEHMKPLLLTQLQD